jgi:glucuronokinase
VHSDLRSRYEHPDPSIHQPVKDSMTRFADLTEEFYIALKEGNLERCMKLQDENFDIRLSIMGEKALGPTNLDMINIARSVGCSAKFSGSGGAVVGIYRNEKYFKDLERAIENKPYRLERIEF